MIKSSKRIKVFTIRPITELLKDEVKYEYSGDEKAADKMYTDRGYSEVVIKNEENLYFGEKSNQGYLIVDGIEI